MTDELVEANRPALVELPEYHRGRLDAGADQHPVRVTAALRQCAVHLENAEHPRTWKPTESRGAAAWWLGYADERSQNGARS